MAQEISPVDWGFALGVLLIILGMLVTDKGLVTSARLNEWKQHARDQKERAERAEAQLHENTRHIERMADLLEVGKDVRRASHEHGD